MYNNERSFPPKVGLSSAVQLHHDAQDTQTVP